MTRDQLQARLDAYLAAEARILLAQETVVGDGSTARTHRMTELSQVRQAIADLRAEISALDAQTAGTASRVVYARPFR